jgi:hypothetical protein
MATLKTGTEVAIRVMLIAVVLFSAFAPITTAQAITSSAEKRVDSPSSDETLATRIMIGESSPTTTGSVPILSEEIAKQAKTQRVDEEKLQIEVSAEPAIYVAGKPIITKWRLTGGSVDQRANLSIVIRPPDGVVPANPTVIPEADGSVTISSKADSGVFAWTVLDYAQFPLAFAFELVLNKEVVNYNAITIDQPLATTTTGRITRITSRDSKVKVDVPSNANSSSMLIDIRAPGPNALRGSSLS